MSSKRTYAILSILLFLGIVGFLAAVGGYGLKPVMGILLGFFALQLLVAGGLALVRRMARKGGA